MPDFEPIHLILGGAGLILIGAVLSASRGSSRRSRIARSRRQILVGTPARDVGRPVESAPQERSRSADAASAQSRSADLTALRNAERKVEQWKAKAVTLSKQAQQYKLKLKAIQERSAEAGGARVEPVTPSSQTDAIASQGALEAAEEARLQVESLKQDLQNVEMQLEEALAEREMAQDQLRDAEARLGASKRESEQLQLQLSDAEGETAAAIEEAASAIDREAGLRRNLIGALGGDGRAEDVPTAGFEWWRAAAFLIAIAMLVIGGYSFMTASASRAVEEEWVYYDNDLPQSRTSARKGGERHGIWQTFHDTGKLASSGAYESGFREGPWKAWSADGAAEVEIEFAVGLAVHETRWWPNGQKRSSGPLEKDLPHGDWSLWHDNGQLSEEGPFVEGRRLGVWRAYDAEGQFIPSRSGTYAGESLADVADLIERGYEGPFIRWHGVGVFSVSGEFVDGLPVGTFTEYHGNGAKSEEWPYLDGLVHGSVRTWGEEGAVLSECAYQAGERHGTSIELYPSGETREKGEYVLGSRVGDWVTWHEDGTKASQVTYREGARQGPCVTFHPGGAKESEGLYEDDQQVGNWVRWFPNGQTRSEGGFIAGLRYGRWTDYHESGQVSERGDYWQDERQGPWEFFAADGSADTNRFGYYHEGERLPGPVRRTAWSEDGALRFEEESRGGQLYFTSRRWLQPGSAVVLSTAWAGELASELETLSLARFTGDVHINWSGSGKPRAVGRMRLGLVEGNWRFFHESGELRTSGAFSEGRPEGTWALLSETGQKLAEVSYRSGELDGAARQWNSSGSLLISGAYDMGSPTGPWKFWYGEDSLLAEGNFVAGMRSGPWRFWLDARTSSAPTLQGSFLEGKKQGLWTYRFRVSEAAPSFAGSFERGVRSGEFRIVGPGGVLRARAEFVGGKHHGAIEFWDAESSKQMSGSYSFGEPSGIWSSWWPSGQMRYQGDHLPSELSMRLVDQLDEQLTLLDALPTLPTLEVAWPWKESSRQR